MNAHVIAKLLNDLREMAHAPASPKQNHDLYLARLALREEEIVMSWTQG